MDLPSNRRHGLNSVARFKQCSTALFNQGTLFKQNDILHLIENSDWICQKYYLLGSNPCPSQILTSIEKSILG